MTPEQKLALARECAAEYSTGGIRIIEGQYDDDRAVQAALLAIERTRIATLEEAASVAENIERSKLAKEYGYTPAFFRAGMAIAAAIRALKGQSNDQG